jgi:hypothetical protein
MQSKLISSSETLILNTMTEQHKHYWCIDNHVPSHKNADINNNIYNI